jgi:hypothetical protein
LVKKVCKTYYQRWIQLLILCRRLRSARSMDGTCHTTASLRMRPKNDCGRRKTTTHHSGMNFKRNRSLSCYQVTTILL